jgi:hypothetical protein
VNLKQNFRNLFSGCPRCGRVFRCECGYVAIAIGIAAVVVAAAGAGYAAYSQSEAQKQQAKMAKRSADQAAAAEQLAGEARARQIQYNADKLKRSFLSREAGAGVQVGQGSLLETEGQFAFDTEYSEQLAKYPHELAGASDQYQSDLFGFKEKSAKSSQWGEVGIGGAVAGVKAYAGSSLATRSSTGSTTMIAGSNSESDR